MDVISKKAKMHRMTRRTITILLTFFVVALIPRGERLVFAASDQQDCAALTQFAMPDVTITAAVAMPAGSPGAVRVAHCKVDGTIGAEIHFTLILPDTWNHKFMMGGGGGFVAGIDNQAIASANDGYATVGTDTGHKGGVSLAGWALDNKERQVNFGYLAVHRVTEVSKAILRKHYGSQETKAYFAGCSNGGRQGLIEAQRYPGDYDGIISGAPAYDFTGIGAQFIKDQQAVFPDPANLKESVLSMDVLKSVEAQIVDKCDTLDGVKDGVMEDPRACKVDINTLAGVTDAQKTALKKVYGEVRDNNGLVYYGQPFGGESDPQGWPLWVVGSNSLLLLSQNTPNLRFAFGTELFKNFVFGIPAWNYINYDFRNFRKNTAKTAEILNATDPNLDKFKGRGGKLVLYHGWSDPALTPLGTIEYYKQVEARDKKARDFARLFLMPGMLHCAGGPGPSSADWNKVLENWVEKGQAPDRVIATKFTGGKPVRTRPLCVYPQKAVYNGTGSIDEEQSFVCR